MENKYFMPERNELFLGYECELSCPACVDKSYKPFVVVEDFFAGGYAESHHFGDELVRTLYLTKEQIENEGWTLIHDGKQNVVSFKKENHEILYYLNEHNTCSNEMTIWYFYQDGLEEKQVFDGKITNINDFRILMKFLGI